MRNQQKMPCMVILILHMLLLVECGWLDFFYKDEAALETKAYYSHGDVKENFIYAGDLHNKGEKVNVGIVQDDASNPKSISKPSDLICDSELFKNTDWSTLGLSVIQESYFQLIAKFQLLDTEDQCYAWYYLLKTADLDSLQKIFDDRLNSDEGKKKLSKDLHNLVEQLILEDENYTPNYQYMGKVYYTDPGIEVK
ncbi:hypothetical protein DFJ63DRAFT_316850 [Scheffersomyces coipomensis]|uniref:uncharacterized protein n=1 Tax=Scheffersomyces coipomensis TaxID=1788519 RepID=UPI00315D49FD